MHSDSYRIRRRHSARGLAETLCRLRTLVTLFVLFAGLAVSDDARAGNAATPLPVGQDNGMRSFAKGTFQAMKGDYWGAIETYRKVTANSPSDAAAVEYFISKAFSSLSVPDSARVHGEAAVRLDPGNSYYARHLARLSHDRQDFARAADLYGQAAASAPDRTDILYSQALEYVAADRPSEALDVFSKILERDHLDEKALSQMLWLQIALKRYPEAIETLNRLVAASGNSMKLRLTLGQLYDLNGNCFMAVDIFKGIIAEDQSAVPAWVALFDQRIRMGNREELLREYRDFENLTPVDVGRSVEVARIFVTRSERDSLFVEPATMMLSELVSRHPGDAAVYQLRGAFEMMRHRYGAAAASFAKAVSLAPGEISGWERLVIAGLELKDERLVFRTISRARLALPRQQMRLSVLEGYALLNTGSPARAARILERVAGRKKGSLEDALLIQANTSLAMAYDQLGNRRRSSVLYARVLDLDAHNSLAMNNLAYLYAEQGVMLQQALRYARNAVLLEPENGVFLDTLGWVHYLLGSYDDAREMLEKAVASGIEEEEVFHHLGKAYEKLGQADKAREMFEKARGVKGK